MNIYEKLMYIQQELKAPKGQYNSFGKYKYRSCEDILEAAKPVLGKYKAAVFISDCIVEIAGRFYIEATATLTDCETGESLSVSANAREEESKKGMDSSQVTGAASSYARKYALNGLFCIDDTKDSDATNTHGKEGKNPPETAPAVSQLVSCTDCGETILPVTHNKKTYSVEEIVNQTTTKYGAPLCWDCSRKRKEMTNA